MCRWLGIDHGSKRIGIAVGDTTAGIASAVTVVAARPHAAAVERIFSLAGEYEATGLVVGWPINMDDTEGPQGKAARRFAEELAEAGNLDVRLWDERLSSFAADDVLAGKLTRKKRRAVQDAVAAAMILRDFLSADGAKSAPRPDEIAKG